MKLVVLKQVLLSSWLISSLFSPLVMSECQISVSIAILWCMISCHGLLTCSRRSMNLCTDYKVNNDKYRIFFLILGINWSRPESQSSDPKSVSRCELSQRLKWFRSSSVEVSFSYQTWKSWLGCIVLASDQICPFIMFRRSSRVPNGCVEIITVHSTER